MNDLTTGRGVGSQATLCLAYFCERLRIAGLSNLRMPLLAVISFGDGTWLIRMFLKYVNVK